MDYSEFSPHNAGSDRPSSRGSQHHQSRSTFPGWFPPPPFPPHHHMPPVLPGAPGLSLVPPAWGMTPYQTVSCSVYPTSATACYACIYNIWDLLPLCVCKIASQYPTAYCWVDVLCLKTYVYIVVCLLWMGTEYDVLCIQFCVHSLRTTAHSGVFKQRTPTDQLECLRTPNLQLWAHCDGYHCDGYQWNLAQVWLERGAHVTSLESKVICGHLSSLTQTGKYMHDWLQYIHTLSWIFMRLVIKGYLGTPVSQQMLGKR